jgi:hypothetical protein
MVEAPNSMATSGVLAAALGSGGGFSRLPVFGQLLREF